MCLLFSFAASALGDAGRPFEPKTGAVADFRGDVGADPSADRSVSAALGRRMPLFSEDGSCGDCVGDARGMEKDEMSGELLYDSAPESEPVDE